MSKIKVKHFGPIKEGYQGDDGWIDIKKVSVFIGNQGTGKSTIAKLISTFTWIEKALVRGDYTKKDFERKGRLRNQYLAYHRLENYFSNDDSISGSTQIEYRGNAYIIKYEKGSWVITENNTDNYPLPQIMYVPAERNFIANVKDPKALRLTSDSLIEFVTEFDNAKREIKDSLRLPINDTLLEYDRLNDLLNVRGNDFRIRLSEASSGFQSLIPLYLVSWHLANTVGIRTDINGSRMNSQELERFRKNVSEIINNNDLSPEQKRVAISVLSSKFTKTAFVNIVEEPEQNLFPASQWEILKRLLKFNNMSIGNKLIMTTHSPYVINYLSIAIQADYLFEKIIKKSDPNSDGSLIKKLNDIVPIMSMVKSVDVSIYQLEAKGNIIKLPDYEGIPTDRNVLNEMLREGNQLFDSLLEIEEEI